MKGLMLAAAVAVPLAPALADPGSNDPFLYTCADLMAAQEGDERVRANMMLMWAIGYMYGRFGGGPDGPMQSAGFDSAATDMVNAFNQVCPNVPDMPIGIFAGNLANDLQAATEREPQSQ